MGKKKQQKKIKAKPKAVPVNQPKQQEQENPYLNLEGKKSAFEKIQNELFPQIEHAQKNYRASLNDIFEITQKVLIDSGIEPITFSYFKTCLFRIRNPDWKEKRRQQRSNKHST